MSITQSFPFTTPSNYTFDTSKVEITGGVAQLKIGDNTGQTFNQDFSATAGFTYDSDKAEFTGGLVRQKDQMPTDGVIVATYDSSIDANYSINGITLTGTGVNTPTIVGNKLLCTGNHGVYYQHANIGFSSAFTIKFKYTPDFTSGPPAATDLVSLHPGSGNNDNVVVTLVSNTIRALIYNNVGSVVQAMAVIGGNPGWVSGVEKEIEINVNPTAGTLTIFIDGVLHGTLSPGTWTRGTSAIRLWVGANPYYGNGNGSYSDLILFNTIQHTSGYTPGYTLEENKYEGSTVELPQFSYSGLGALQAFTAYAGTDTNAPRYVLNDLYWDGAAWSASDGSFAQANIIADINTNIASLTVSDTLDIDIVFQDSASVQMSTADLTMTYTGQAYPTDNPTVEINQTWRLEDLEGFTETSTVAGSDAITYYLKKGATKYYYNSGWVESDGTYAQSTTAADVETNKATFTTVAVTFGVVLFLHSNDGTTTPEIDLLSIDYDFAGETPDTVNTCIVYGYAKNGDNTVNTAPIKAYLDKDVVEYKTNTMLRNVKTSATPGSTDGYWEMELVENENMDQGARYLFEFADNVDGKKYLKRRKVPDETTKAWNDLGV